MVRETLSDNIIILGVDGMDPRLTKKYLDLGLMPNLKKCLEMGAAREDLVLLGGVPTITPPMWTTLSTGAYPATHGITCFWSQHPNKIDTFVYSNDSKNCKAEQLWNVFVESGKKALVWHWPGCSWPPTSESENLHVVEGTQPSAINFGIGKIDEDGIFVIDEAVKEVVHHDSDGVRMNGAGCVIDGMEVEDKVDVMDSLKVPEPQPISLSPDEGESSSLYKEKVYTEIPLKEAKGWQNSRKGDKEFSLMFCEGKVRRVGLYRKNEEGIYNTVELYRSKKDLQPLVVLTNENDFAEVVFDELLDTNDKKVKVTRSYIVTDLDPEGKKFTLWAGNATKVDCDALFSPHRLYNYVIENAGYIPSIELQNHLGKDTKLLEKIMLRAWRAYGDWQARAMNALIEKEGYNVVFSHYHNLDNFGHIFYDNHNTFGDEALDEEYEKLFQQIYMDTDRYFGNFLHLLDKDWTIIITSDHGLLCKEEPGLPPGLGDGFVVNASIMRELGYTVMKRDATGKELHEIDYGKTKAVASRGNHIYLNLKSRYPYGIVEDNEKYELEKQIITDLYNYRNEAGDRIISLAIRNQDGALLGLTGEACGDILYWVEEGHTRVHGDSLSTFKGHADTSVSPIFVAAGKGVKHGFYTDRVIRQVDVAPTVAVLGGVRMPHQCEGAPIYQILNEEF